jgi:tetratricopeptide (TPR) repeat protein
VANKDYSEMFMLLETAQKMELFNNDSKALEIYLRILDEYDPNVTIAFERPGLLLEKKGRYNEAIKVYQKAIEFINSNKLSASVEKFQGRIDRINDKFSSKEETKQKVKKSSYYKRFILWLNTPSKMDKVEKKENENFENKSIKPINDSQNQIKSIDFIPLGINSKKKSTRLLAYITYTLAIVSSLLLSNVFILLTFISGGIGIRNFLIAMRKKSKKNSFSTIIFFLLTLVLMLSSFIFYNPIDLKDVTIENLNSAIENMQTRKALKIINDKDLENLDITDSILQKTRLIINDSPIVIDSQVIAKDDKLLFYIIFKNGTSKNDMKNVGKEALKIFSQVISAQYEEVNGPSDSSFGEIYKVKNTAIVLADSTGVVLEGFKSIFGRIILWK